MSPIIMNAIANRSLLLELLEGSVDCIKCLLYLVQFILQELGIGQKSHQHLVESVVLFQ
jgi:hypothetical protein